MVPSTERRFVLCGAQVYHGANYQAILQGNGTSEGNALTSNGADYVSFAYLRFNNINQFSSGIVFTHSSYSTINNCYFDFNSGSHCIKMQGADGECINNIIEKNVVNQGTGSDCWGSIGTGISPLTDKIGNGDFIQMGRQADTNTGTFSGHIIRYNDVTMQNSRGILLDPHSDCVQIYRIKKGDHLVIHNNIFRWKGSRDDGNTQGIYATSLLANNPGGVIDIYNNIFYMATTGKNMCAADNVIKTKPEPDPEYHTSFIVLRIWNNTFYAGSNWNMDNHDKIIGVNRVPLHDEIVPPLPSGSKSFQLINNIFANFSSPQPTKLSVLSLNDRAGYEAQNITIDDDLGITWRWSQTGLPPKITGYKLAVSGTDTYLTTNAAGVFKSTDYGDSWFDVNNGLNAAVVRKLAIDKDGIFYTASWSNGLSKSTDKGETWTMINNGVSNVYFYSIVADDNGNLMAGSEYGVYRSTDKGENWIQTSSVGNNFGYDLTIDNKNRIYCITYGSGLFRTTDLGYTWHRLDNNFNTGYIFGLAIDNKNNIYTGTAYGTVYKSTDDGSSWQIVFQSSVSQAAIGEVKISPNGTPFITCYNEGVLRSTDEGVSWTLVRSDNTRYLRFYPLEINRNGVIFTIDSNWKIYSSSDNGNTWEDITSNTKYLSIRSFTIDEHDNIYLATNESVWKSNPDSLTSAAEDDIKPKEYFLSQNYPNPFNPTTTIKYSLAQTGRVTLSIYDILGREVVKLIDEEKPAGEYETKWNASSHPSGVYFMRMQAGEFGETRKIVLVK